MKKLNLKELELKLPKIDENYSKILLGGDSYGGEGEYGDRNDLQSGPTGPLYDPGDFQIKPPMDYDNSHDLDVSVDGYNDFDGANDLDGGPNDNTDHNNNNQPQEIKLNNLPAEVPHQVGNGSCVSTSAEFVFSALGQTQTEAQLIHEWAAANGMNAGQEAMFILYGLNPAEQENFINFQFNTQLATNVTDITQAIDNGRPVMISYNTGQVDPATGEQIYHQVTVVGYDNATGQFVVADTQGYLTGDADGYININQSQVDFNFNQYIILGIKP